MILGACQDCGAPATVEPEGNLLCNPCAHQPQYVEMWERVVAKLEHARLHMFGGLN